VTKSQLKLLQRNTSTLQKALSDLGRAAELKELIRIYKRPGWTTPAEFALVGSHLKGLLRNVESLRLQIQELRAGAAQVR
jgi:hypothetical protein